jgi:hypothetical protein
MFVLLFDPHHDANLGAPDDTSRRLHLVYECGFCARGFFGLPQ